MSFKTDWEKTKAAIKNGGMADTLLPIVGRVALMVLGLAVMYLFATIEYTFLGTTIPHIPAFRWIGLAFFSLGFPVWLIIFLHVAVGSDQHLISRIMSWVSLGAAVCVSGYELAFGNTNPNDFVRASAVVMVVITASANLVAYAIFHFRHPKYQLIRATNDIRDEINDGIETQVKTQMKSKIPTIVGAQSTSIVSGMVDEYADQLAPNRNSPKRLSASPNSNHRNEVREPQPEREARFR